MKHFPRVSRLFSLLAMLNVGMLLHAEEPAKPVITTRFRVISWVPGQPEGFSYLSQGKQAVVKELSSSLRSSMLDYTGPATLSIYARDARLEKPRSGDALPEPLARVVLPPNIKYPLVVLAPNPAGPLPLRALVFEDDPEAFPFGSYLFINSSGQRVAASMGKNRFIIEPGQKNLVHNDERAYRLQLAVPKGDAGWRKVYDNFFPNWDTGRTMVFMIDTPTENGSRVSLRTLIENKAVWDKSSPSN